MVYDVTDRDSFNSVDTHIHNINEFIDYDFVKILCGNKIDLADERKITTDEGLKKADEHGMFFIETSATKGICVRELFKLAANEIKFTFLDDKIDNHAQKLNDQKVIVNKKSLC